MKNDTIVRFADFSTDLEPGKFVVKNAVPACLVVLLPRTAEEIEAL
jgi:hypothetical protein